MTASDEPKSPSGIEPTIDAALELLCQTFPKAFVRYEARRRPLKIGIYEDLRAALNGAITDVELGRTLRVYCSNRVYRSRLIAGATRIDLDGKPAGTVSAEHAVAHVVARPAPRPKPTPDRGRGQEAASDLSSRKRGSPPSPRPAPAKASVKRMSLQDLREAARRRKAEGFKNAD